MRERREPTRNTNLFGFLGWRLRIQGQETDPEREWLTKSELSHVVDVRDIVAATEDRFLYSGRTHVTRSRTTIKESF